MSFNPIGWCHYTINFWWGCDEVSPACAHCYARETAKVRSQRFFGRVVKWGKHEVRAERLEAARKEALALERKAVRNGVRYRVFSLSMGDWLDDQVPVEWLAFLLETIHLTPHLDWLLLTKRPENFAERFTKAVVYLEGEAEQWASNWILWEDMRPANVWIGATVEDQARAVERIPALLQIPARVRFLSCEPMCSEVNFLKASDAWPTETHPWRNAPLLTGIHWVICGGESGHKARPMHPQWARSLRDQCAAAGVAFYFKQWGEWCPQSEPATAMLPPKCATHRWEDVPFNGCYSYRVGTKAAGRLLDGQEHNAFPA